MTAAWLALVATGVVAVTIDITLALRRPDRRLRTALVGSLSWAVVGLAFTGVVRALLGSERAGDYLTVFLLEKSLSLDILAALVLRLAFVTVGIAAVSAVHWILIVFGVILLVAGLRMAHQREAAPAEVPRVVRWLRRRRVNTALAALLALAVTDLVFAIDSVPAAFAVTHDAYPIAAANVFAVLGLRPLYDLLATAMDRLVYLERALGVLLALIGVALVIEPVYEVPEWMILTGVVTTLGAGVMLSLVPPRRLLVSVGGFVLLLAGAAMLVLPGPGLLVIAAGLAVLATEYLWARRMLDGVKARLPARPGMRSSKSRAGRGKRVRRARRTPSEP
jgi:tellurite resistance protein TerC